MSDRKADVLNQLKVIMDPDLGKDIVSLGFIKELTIKDPGHVSFQIELTTPACPVKSYFQQEAEKQVQALGWVQKVTVHLTSRQPKYTGTSPISKGLEKVGAIIAVSSCKGGVGKSTVAVNLAFALAESGAKVGIFDADINGPSLPTKVYLPHAGVFYDGEWIVPLEAKNVKLMSFGYTQAPGEEGPAILRGPMVAQIINQLLTGTQWGELDYLIIDMPPGTGDIQITLSQIIPLTAAVIVTTPQKISFIDVIKGIQMFEKLNVPTISAVQNMSYYEVGGKNHYIFGKGAIENLNKEYGFPITMELPIHPDVSEWGDNGIPLVLQKPESPITALYQDLAGKVAQEVSKLRYSTPSKPELTYEPGRGMVFKYNGQETVWTPKAVRLLCQCAYCIHEMTGERKLTEVSVLDTIHPLDIRPVGNYAVGIAWSDGHSSLLPYQGFQPVG